MKNPRPSPRFPSPRRPRRALFVRHRPVTQQVIRSFTNVVTHLVGCDIDLDTTLGSTSVADELMLACEGTPFILTLISNRGTQVWPMGSVYTECADSCRVRFELREGASPGQFGQSHTVALS